MRVLPALLLSLLAGAPATAEDRAGPSGFDYFEKHVRPLLIRRCYACHSGRAKPLEGGLRLDSKAGWKKGGDSGPALVPGKPKKSLLVKAIGYADDSLQMPPKQKLPAAEIAILVKWISRGAPDPRTNAPSARRGGADHWAFQPLTAPDVPETRNAGWAATPVDHFLLARWQHAGLGPSPEADRRTLMRRVSFDLLGLPPTPGETRRFLADTAPAAWERLIERLLASPHYGQRWGRHWLDVARYADSNGLDENVAHGNAWRYRDWVVAAFNADLPYDQFLREQLAGDLLGSDRPPAERHRGLIATGFLSMGPKVLAEVDGTKMEMDIVDEQVDTFGRSLLGLTLGCARCHDHKFDPVSTRDYYALAGIFKSTRTMEHFKKVARWWENPIPTARQQARFDEHKQEVVRQKSRIGELLKAARAALGKKPQAGQTPDKGEEKQFPAATQKTLKQLRDALAKLETSAPTLPTAMGVTEGTVADARIHVRGSHLDLGETARRGVPAVLARTVPVKFPAKESGRRELAEWLTRPDHPLTARVFANRIWRWHFGRGLVATPDNFGQLGDRPTHPRLLDWLATELIRGGWSLKRMHRTIVLSRAYRMQSRPRPEAMAVDPENRLWWRAPLRRLEAEALRDSLLAVASSLDTTMGGSLLHVKNRGYFFDHTSKDETRYDSPRRSLYLPVVRNHLYDVFTLFDYTDASVLTGHRATTTVAPQALFLLNSPLVEQVSRQLATAAIAAVPEDQLKRTCWLYERILGRPVTLVEAERARSFQLAVLHELRKQRKFDQLELDTWSALCHVLVASNEFIYLR